MLFRSKTDLRCYGLKYVLLRVDPLKDAVGSPFGKADRLYLYLHVQKLCQVGEQQHCWHISVNYVIHT